MPDINTKNNVAQYARDILEHGAYSNKVSLAIQLAGKRINDGLFKAYPVEGKRVLDIGSGDGLADLDFLSYGAVYVKGYEPCKEAVEIAQVMTVEKGLTNHLNFEVGNIYELEPKEQFDVTVLRSIIHHLPDPQRALQAIAPFTQRLLIMEPNGFNPVLKIIEKTSSYHRAHEEQSFTLWRLKMWLEKAGFKIKTSTYINLVPNLCPDWLARICKFFEPLVEKVPLVRHICCGQVIIYAERTTPPQI